MLIRDLDFGNWMSKNIETVFKDKTLIVTGAANGIGKSLATTLDSIGANLILIDVDKPALDELARNLINQCFCLYFSVDDRESWLDAKNKIHQHLVHENKPRYIHGLFNNAGIAHDSVELYKMPTEQYKKIMDINFYSILYATQIFLEDLKQQETSFIVNISSIFGSAGIANLNAYCASKFAVKGFTESLRMEASAFFPNVQVCLIQPGGINTQIAHRALQIKADNDQRQHEIKTFNKLLRTSPQTAAHKILSGVAKGKKRILIGADAKLLDVITRLLPEKYTTLCLTYIKNIGLLHD